MKIDDVPQDRGMISDDRREICYAVDEDDLYVLAQSAGWEVKNIANDQAWDIIRQQVDDTLKKIEAGELSPLAFHMVKNQMNVSLLAKYVRINRWRVKRHLKPEVYTRLKPSVLKKYAYVFEISVEQLSEIPKAN
jgi:ribosomal protein RSM22 (predicted rRNA methylase)